MTSRAPNRRRACTTFAGVRDVTDYEGAVGLSLALEPLSDGPNNLEQLVRRDGSREVHGFGSPAMRGVDESARPVHRRVLEPIRRVDQRHSFPRPTIAEARVTSAPELAGGNSRHGRVQASSARAIPVRHERRARPGPRRARGIDGALPEGAEVVVLTPGHDEPFELDEAQLAELESRMVEADGGEVEPAESVLASLRRSR